MRNIRDSIVAARRQRLQTRGHAQGLTLPEARLLSLVPFSSPPLLICEIKRRSPSRGNIALDMDPLQRVKAYYEGGVRTFSVLTEEEYFGGSLSDLWAVKSAYPEATVLRKDFLLDVEDIEVSYRLGADAVLLIASILEQEKLEELYRQAKRLGLSVLVEVHTREDVEKVRPLCPEWVGINARNLETFRTDLLHPLRVRSWIDWDARVVFESGVHTPEDGCFVGSAGFEGLLVGEAVVRDPARVPKLRAAYVEAYERYCRAPYVRGGSSGVTGTASIPERGPAPVTGDKSAAAVIRGTAPIIDRGTATRQEQGGANHILSDIPFAASTALHKGKSGSVNRSPFWVRLAEAVERKRPLVKVCGITNREDARLAVEAGADLLGFVFAPSPRQVSPALLQEVRDLDVLRVGVVVLSEEGIKERNSLSRVEELKRWIQEGCLDAIQVHGTYDRDLLQKRGLPFYSVWNPASRKDVEALLEAMPSPRFLLDGSKEGKLGGTGVRVADEVLEVCRERGVPLWLAGGLRPESIREIVETWNPELVDVSSGLEAYPGKKDPEKVRRFFKEIQDACTVVGR